MVFELGFSFVSLPSWGCMHENDCCHPGTSVATFDGGDDDSSSELSWSS
jgi:hypothetical protein